MKIFKKIFLVILIILIIPINVNAQSDYEFYFFGTNIKIFKNSNWLKVTAGAVVSILVHEMGHALYLESQGKNWNLCTMDGGFAISTSDHLSKNQYRNFGRAGFILQTSISTILTSFEKTRYSDFTKGWVGINTFQLGTYNIRHQNIGDFYLIDQGDGNVNLEHGIFYLMSSYNLLKLND